MIEKPRRTALILLCLIPAFIVMSIVSFLYEALQFEHGLDAIEPSSDGLRSGDLILVASLRIVPSFSWYKHVAIVYEDRMKQIRIADFTITGLKTSTIHSFFSEYSRHVVFALRRLQTPLTEQQNEKLLAYVAKTENCVVSPHYVVNWIRHRVLGPPKKLEDDNCANFVANCMLKAEILGKAPWSYLTITDFTYSRGCLPMYQKEVIIDRTFFPSLKISK